jgi:hypothetical protein
VQGIGRVVWPMRLAGEQFGAADEHATIGVDEEVVRQVVPSLVAARTAQQRRDSLRRSADPVLHAVDARRAADVLPATVVAQRRPYPTLPG